MPTTYISLKNPGKAIFIPGLFILYFSFLMVISLWGLTAVTPSSCSNSKLRLYLRGLMIIAAIGLTAMISLAICTFSCYRTIDGGPGGLKPDDNKITLPWWLHFTLFGLTACGAVFTGLISTELSSSDRNCYSSKFSYANAFGIAVSSVLSAMLLMYAFVKIYYRHKAQVQNEPVAPQQHGNTVDVEAIERQKEINALNDQIATKEARRNRKEQSKKDQEYIKAQKARLNMLKTALPEKSIIQRPPDRRDTRQDITRPAIQQAPYPPQQPTLQYMPEDNFNNNLFMGGADNKHSTGNLSLSPNTKMKNNFLGADNTSSNNTSNNTSKSSTTIPSSLFNISTPS